MTFVAAITHKRLTAAYCDLQSAFIRDYEMLSFALDHKYYTVVSDLQGSARSDHSLTKSFLAVE